MLNKTKGVSVTDTPFFCMLPVLPPSANGAGRLLLNLIRLSHRQSSKIVIFAVQQKTF